MKKLDRRAFLRQTAALGTAIPVISCRNIQEVRSGFASGFASAWHREFDQAWLGREFWSNPLQDWRIAAGRLECRSSGGGRNVHILTHQLGVREHPFALSVRLGLITRGGSGSAGFRIGVHDLVNDYRGNLCWGRGVDAGVNLDGRIFIGAVHAPLDPTDFTDLALTLEASPLEGGQYRLLLECKDRAGLRLGSVETNVPAASLLGNLCLVNNFDDKIKNGSRFWFNRWQGTGGRIESKPDQSFGPILWSMYTVSDSRGPDGQVLKLSAQMPPVAKESSQSVLLEVKGSGGTWSSVGEEMIDPDSRTATFEKRRWDSSSSVEYRLSYLLKFKDGSSELCQRFGIIRAEPRGRSLVFAPLTCQHFDGFPYAPLAEQLRGIDPDLVYFSGDQIYEVNGHFWIVRSPVDDSILCYLGKYFMFGMAFGEIMRDRPTVCSPDDHDVFQPNIWGNGGNAIPYERHDAGGYVQDPRFVNMVHRSQMAHHPRFFDDTPIDQGISVFYGDLVYGRVSFALVSDRMFKSGPKDSVCDWAGRADLIEDKKYDVGRLDKPGLDLLGTRQLAFLEHWAQDWRGADMKVVLSQSPFAQVLTHSGSRHDYFQGDLDAHGWPHTARQQAIMTMRKAFPLHVTGDQHITTMMQYGVEHQRDSCWSLCVPAISVGWQRWWVPDEVGIPHQNRPRHNLPNTGEYSDGLGNKIFVYAVANPEGSSHSNRYRRADIKVSGFSIVRIDPETRTYECASYRFLPSPDGRPIPFPGFPLLVHQRDNFPAQSTRRLPEVRYQDCPEPVLKVYSQKTGELIYALRLKTQSIQPWAYSDAAHKVVIGDPDQDDWLTFINQSPRTSDEA
ncbi:MAG: hypothetical protein RL095_2392 [Verrucomicrobiota bacterium]